MQFDRLINLRIRLTDPTNTGYRGNLLIDNLRITFSVFKTESWSTNTAEIKIYNLGPDNRNQLSNYGDEVRLFAGYRDNGGTQLLFTGNVTQLSHIFAEPEIISVLNVGDGERVLNQLLIPVSFGAGISVRTVIEYIADKMGLELVDFALTEDFKYATGFKGVDLAKNILDNTCRKLGLTWSVQNNNLVIVHRSIGTNKPPVEINANTGMIGIPERFTDKRQYLYRALPPNEAPKPGWKIRTLLNPSILPGDRVKIKSLKADIDGLYYVLTIRHEGDNYGPQFESILEVVAL